MTDVPVDELSPESLLSPSERFKQERDERVARIIAAIRADLRAETDKK